MHRLHRPLKPNIPYNKKFRFSKGGCAVMCSRLFCFCASESSCFYSCRFPSHSLP